LERVYASIASPFIVVPEIIRYIIKPRSDLLKIYLIEYCNMRGREIGLAWFRRIITVLAGGASDAFDRSAQANGWTLSGPTSVDNTPPRKPKFGDFDGEEEGQAKRVRLDAKYADDPPTLRWDEG
jgi:hypothetical protein